MLSNLGGNTFINVGLLLRALSRVNFLLLLPSRSTSHLPHLSFILFSESICPEFVWLKRELKIWTRSELKAKSNIYFLKFWSPQKNFKLQARCFLSHSLKTSSFFIRSHFCCPIISTFSSRLFQFDSVWINCSSYGRRHTISLNPDNGVWLGRGEYTANLLTAHLPNDWCLHATSPEECLSQRHFLHLNNAHTPEADVMKDAHQLTCICTDTISSR